MAPSDLVRSRPIPDLVRPRPISPSGSCERAARTSYPSGLFERATGVSYPSALHERATRASYSSGLPERATRASYLAAARDRRYRRDRLTKPRLVVARSYSVSATSFYDRLWSAMCWLLNLRLNLPHTESDGRGFFSQIRLMSGLPPHLLTKAKQNIKQYINKNTNN